MTALRPFFLLLGRASVFWIGVAVVFTGATIVVGAARPETPIGRFLDASLIATLWFSAAAGWLAGLVIQEFQHATFAYPLPGVRRRLGAGYLATGLVVAAVVAGTVAGVGSTSLGLPLLFALALGAYGVGGALQDPLSGWMTFTNTMLVLAVFPTSRELARIAGEHPWTAAAVALAIGAAGVGRLFARSTFRRKPFRLSKPLPGRFSIEKTRRYERQRRLRDRPKTTDWGKGYIGGGPWAWVRAAFHEAHGAFGWKTVLKGISRPWALYVMVVLHAWLDKGRLSFVEALGRTIYDGLFRPPFVAPLGEKHFPYLLVVIVIAGVGVVTALFNAVALTDGMPHPLSRLQRAQVAFRAGLVDVALFLLGLGAGLYVVGQVTGVLLGFGVRFDFMPSYFRALMVTLILLPLAHRGRLRLQAATRRREANTIVAVSFGIVAFVLIAALCVAVLPRIVASPAAELTVLVAALVLSQLTYRHNLKLHYQTADLA